MRHRGPSNSLVHRADTADSTSRTLALEKWGPPDAPRAVCLHGVTSHGRHFAQLAATALSGFRILAPDLLGHGSSPYEPPWSIDAQLEAIVETVGEDPAVLVGHSFGARLALELAARAPKLVPRLVLLDPAILVLPHVALFAAENARRERAYVSFEEGIDRRYDESQLLRAPRELVEQELEGHLILRENGVYRYRYCQAAVVAAYGEMASQPPPFERARIPTLLVIGEQSYLPYDHLLDAHQAALGDLLEVVVVPGGHTVLWDALEETAEAVGVFLGREG
jgi:lipase